MKKITFRISVVCALFLVCMFSVSAQSRKADALKTDGNFAASALRGTGNVAVIIVGSAAKATWVTSKFLVKDVSGSVAKTIFVRAAPAIGVFMLKQSGVLAKKAVPIAIKVGLM